MRQDGILVEVEEEMSWLMRRGEHETKQGRTGSIKYSQQQRRLERQGEREHLI
jgi:hypothetical protein